MDLKDRFLKYVSFDTQADESSTSFPSTEKQLVLLRYLKEELETIGLKEVTMDEYGYVMGTLPATKGCENAPVIGFISHVDTAPDMSGANVKPYVVENYDGRDILLGGDVWLRVEEFPELPFFKGHTLIHTDGELFYIVLPSGSDFFCALAFLNHFAYIVGTDEKFEE